MTAIWPDWQVESEYYYTGATCQRCGKLLNSDGGHPAEIYAGTFNGLCYGCTAARPHVVKVAVLDGARIVSWPPHCPSYRRDRDTYTAYPDCGACKGTGVQRRNLGSTGYREGCKACLARYCAHPVRVLDMEWRCKLREAGNRAYQRGMSRLAGLKPRSSRRTQEAAWEALGDEAKAGLRAEIMPRYESLLARHEARIARLNGAAWRPPATEEKITA